MKIYEITKANEANKLDEFVQFLPLIVAGVRIAGPWAIKQGAKIIAKRGAAASVAGTVAKKGGEVIAKGTGNVIKGIAKAPIKHPIATTTIGGGAYVAKKAGDGVEYLVSKGEEGIDAIKDKIIEAIGADGFAKVAAMASKYAIPALAAVAIIYGGKKIWDYLSSVGDQEELATESATAGATASASIAGVANPIAANAKIKRDKNGVPIAPQKKNKDGTAVNALDIKNNIMGGKAIKRVQ